jgi:hypothetical protein
VSIVNVTADRGSTSTYRRNTSGRE